MQDKALGMIETVGMVPAVESADVAVKSASVTLLACQCVGSGLVSILMTGDVAAVKASVDAGAEAARRVGTVKSTHVIARTAEGLETILVDATRGPKWAGQAASAAKEEPLPEAAPAAAPESGDEVEARSVEPEAEEVPVPDPIDERGPAAAPAVFAPTPNLPPMEDLKRLKVTRLRTLARKLERFPIARNRIKFAKKTELLSAFAALAKAERK